MHTLFLPQEKDVVVQQLFELKAKLNDQCELSLESIGSSVNVTLKRPGETPSLIALDYDRDPISSFTDALKTIQSKITLSDLSPVVCAEQGCSPLTNAIGQRLLPSPTNFGSAA